VNELLENSFAYLSRRVMASPWLPTLQFHGGDYSRPRVVKTVAVPALVGASLLSASTGSAGRQAAEKIAHFLMAEREDNWRWRFFGRGSDIHADVDDTAFMLAFLAELGGDVDHATRVRDLECCLTDDGTFFTWFDRPSSENTVDWVSNVNVLYYLYLVGQGRDIVEQFVSRALEASDCWKASPYYGDPLQGLYFCSRLWRRFGPSWLERFRSVIKSRLAETLSTCDTAFRHVLAAAAWANFGFGWHNPQPRAWASADGSYPVGSIFNHRRTDLSYGSAELTAALLVESVGSQCDGGSEQ